MSNVDTYAKVKSVTPYPSTIHNVKRGILTTGDCAFFCRVAPRTVAKWCEAGRLEHYRIPGSMDRRILLPNLVKFMKANHFPLHSLLHINEGLWVTAVEDKSQQSSIQSKLIRMKPQFLNIIDMFSKLMSDVPPKWLIIGESLGGLLRQQLIDSLMSRIHIPTGILVIVDEAMPNIQIEEIQYHNDIKYGKGAIEIQKFFDINWANVLTESKMEVA